MFQSLRHCDVQVVVSLLRSQVLHTMNVHRTASHPLTSGFFVSSQTDVVENLTYNHVKLGVNIHNFACKET